MTQTTTEPRRIQCTTTSIETILSLLRAQGLHGFEARGPARWQICSDQGDRCKQARHDNEGEWVTWPDAEQKALQQTRQSERSRNSDDETAYHRARTGFKH